VTCVEAVAPVRGRVRCGARDVDVVTGVPARSFPSPGEAVLLSMGGALPCWLMDTETWWLWQKATELGLGF